MHTHSSKVIITQMTAKEPFSWSYESKHKSNRLLRNTAFFAAGSLCLGVCAWIAANQPQKAEAVMSHLTSGFEYDETLGRLQLVSNMLPESAMVFLTTDDSQSLEFVSPVSASTTHTWTQQEPWLEYSSIGDIAACQAGEIMTIVKNHAGMHTVRILHDDGYESVYSGLHTVFANENDTIQPGEIIGTSSGTASFELRKDGISILPVFSEM